MTDQLERLLAPLKRLTNQALRRSKELQNHKSSPGMVRHAEKQMSLSAIVMAALQMFFFEPLAPENMGQWCLGRAIAVERMGLKEVDSAEERQGCKDYFSLTGQTEEVKKVLRDLPAEVIPSVPKT